MSALHFAIATGLTAKARILPMTELPEADAIQPLLRAIASELALELTDLQMAQLATHFSLLLRWNRKMNLTSLRPAEIAWRHFGESLFLTTILRPSIESPESPIMVDVGSGAGFPGLPLKIAWPWLGAVLLEPSQKKAVFLKEVVRAGGIQGVEVRTERSEEAVEGNLRGRAHLVTMRAVATSEALLRDLSSLLRPRGQLALFLGANDAARIQHVDSFEWAPAVAIPHSERRVILVGRVRPKK